MSLGNHSVLVYIYIKLQIVGEMLLHASKVPRVCNNSSKKLYSPNFILIKTKRICTHECFGFFICLNLLKTIRKGSKSLNRKKTNK